MLGGTINDMYDMRVLMTESSLELFLAIKEYLPYRISDYRKFLPFSRR